MDFITVLLKSKGKTVITIVVDRLTKYAIFFSLYHILVDRLTKYAIFFSLYHPFEAIIVATTFMETVQKLRGVPKIIVSERDPIFTEIF
jgi:hypothetical protein